MTVTSSEKKIKYAVIGLGHIAQKAILPAFKNASSNSELTALVSGSKDKLTMLGDKYHVHKRYLYSQFDECLKRREIDAIYISTPNFFHRSIMERAASFGVHVLCEKPLSVTPDDCLSMIELANQNNIKLMTAYRLYLDDANNDVLKMINEKKIGEAKIFTSSFVIEVKDPQNIRLENVSKGGGPLHDIGIYCINAARRIFNSMPIQVFALALNSKDPKFSQIDETISCTLKFPEDKMAIFTVSFGAYPVSDYEIIGTKGNIRMENSYSYNHSRHLKLFENGKSHSKTYREHDQFADELFYFSNCIISNASPTPSGEEGFLDIKIIEALLLSLDLGKPIDTKNINKKPFGPFSHPLKN